MLPARSYAKYSLIDELPVAVARVFTRPSESSCSVTIAPFGSVRVTVGVSEPTSYVVDVVTVLSDPSTSTLSTLVDVTRPTMSYSYLVVTLLSSCLRT